MTEPGPIERRPMPPNHHRTTSDGADQFVLACNARRVGFSRGGKAALFRIARYALILAVVVIAFVWGRHFGAGR